MTEKKDIRTPAYFCLARKWHYSDDGYQKKFHAMQKSCSLYEKGVWHCRHFEDHGQAGQGLCVALTPKEN